MHWSNLIVIRYFRSRKKDKFVNLTSKIATFSISFGVAMLIVAFSVIRGFEESIFNKVLQDQGHIAIFADGNFDPANIISRLPDGLQHKAIVETHGMLTGTFRTETTLLRGVSQAEIAELESTTHKRLVDGKNKAYIGCRLARNMGLNIGDTMQIIVPVKSVPPFGFVPEQVECVVADIVKFKTHDLNRFGVFVDIGDAQKMLNMGNKVTKVLCYANSPKAAINLAFKIQLKNPTYQVYTWQDLNMLFADVMRIQRNMVSVILFAIIFLAITASLASLALFINMKKREISILMILGATKRSIVMIFLKIAALIAFTSSVIGTVVGLALAYNLDNIRRGIEYITNRSLFNPDVYLLPAIPISIHVSDVVLIVVASFVISIIAAILPSYKSASVNVLENL